MASLESTIHARRPLQGVVLDKDPTAFGYAHNVHFGTDSIHDSSVHEDEEDSSWMIVLSSNPNERVEGGRDEKKTKDEKDEGSNDKSGPVYCHQYLGVKLRGNGSPLISVGWGYWESCVEFVRDTNSIRLTRFIK